MADDKMKYLDALDNLNNQQRFYVETDTGRVSYLESPWGSGNAYSFQLPANKGRPIDKDWQGVLRYLIARAVKGKLSTKPADLEKAILEWFETNDLDDKTSRSQAQQQVSLILKEINGLD